MESQIFCDGIGRISIIGGVVRLDLFTFSPSETDANGNPRPVLTHRITMGADAFLRSSEKVVEAVQLISRPRQQAPAPPPVPAQPQGQTPPPAPQPAAAAQLSPQAPARAPQPPPSRPPFP